MHNCPKHKQGISSGGFNQMYQYWEYTCGCLYAKYRSGQVWEVKGGRKNVFWPQVHAGENYRYGLSEK